MNRTQLQNMARARLEDAKALFAAKRWHGAYYLAGYAVECGLKACVLAHVEKTGAIFLERKFSENCWTHDLVKLVQQANLTAELGLASQADPIFAGNWGVTKDWTEESRYFEKTEPEANDLIQAIDDTNSGVMAWLQNHW